MKTSYSIIWIFVMILSTGCGDSAINVGTPAVNIPHTEIITPTLIGTFSPTNTATAIPTLDAEQARDRLIGLLSNNGECRLPCLWGITPGVSKYQDARTILAPLTGISNFRHLSSSSPDDISLVYADGDLNLSTYIAYMYADNDGMVSSISFQVKISQENKDGYVDVFDAETFDRKVGAYILSSILLEHGKPEAVLISTYRGEERGKNVPGFYMILFYPDQGLLVSYTTYRQLIGEKVRGCLANAHVELELFPAGQPDSFVKNLSQTKWKNLWPTPVESPNWKSIENATSLTLEQFYETFREPTDKCIDTLASLWPTPEP